MTPTTCAPCLLLVAGLAIAGSPAPTASTTETTKVDFSTLDKDNNGSLSREEARTVADFELVFADLDQDHDQAVSPPEFTRWKRAGKVSGAKRDPATTPSGSAGSQHMPETS